MVHRIQSPAARKLELTTSFDRDDWATRAERVAKIASAHAEDVDRDARFPSEAVAALRQERLLGAFVPEEFGGEQADLSDLIEICFRLGQACSATAMIYAMHQTSVACIVRHGPGNCWQEDLLRSISSKQLLLASSTTEGSAGGDLRSSEAAVERTGAFIQLDRLASCISYGGHADGVVTTARRSSDSSATQQALVAFLKENYTLERRLSWDTLGMRGTCSVGYRLLAKGVADQVLQTPFDKINSQTMMPVAHLLWAAAWAGIAAGAINRTRLFTSQAMRKSAGKMPPGAAHLVRGGTLLDGLRSRIDSAARKYAEVSDDPHILGSLDFQTGMAFLKVEASDQAVAIALECMRACGLSGYRNDTEFSIGRHLRDLLSAPIMINNDRILSSLGQSYVMCSPPETIA